MLKKIIIMLTAIIMLTQICVFAEEVDSVQTRIYVAESGNDTNDGTENSPFATIKRAKEEVRKYNTSMTGNIEVIIGEGTYFLDDTLVFSPEDSGNNGYKVIYKGINKPTISGGMKIDGFEVLENGMWKTNVPKLSVMRELYVNKGRRYRASTEREIVGLSNYNDPNTGYDYDGIVLDRDVFDIYENAEDMSFRWATGWKHHEMRVDKIIAHPNDSTKVVAIMQQPLYEHMATDREQSHPVRYYFGFRAENAFELLDMAGEYYFNEKTKDLYYLPLEGENIETADVYAPVLEYLIKVHGVGMDKTKNIEFENITFAHCAYNMPDRIGHTHGQWSDLQVYDSMEENFGHGAIDIFNADNVNLNNCMVYGTGYVGVNIYTSSNCSFTGGAIYDTGGSAVNIGLPTTALETEKPENAMGNAMREAYFEVSSYGKYGTGQYRVTGAGADWRPENDVTAGVKSWLKVDFKKEISVDEIVFDMYSDEGSSRRKNFEIILSNDPQFDSYKSVYSVGNTAVEGRVVSVKPKTTEKFRYMMIRKSQVEIFGLGNLQVYSNDVPWQPTDICKNITIKNNYITRASSYYYGLPSITAYYTNDLTIDHNEIYWSPYTAIGVGWGWVNTVSEKFLARSKITNNRIEYYNMEAHDGGAIYTLSRNTDSVISGNYTAEGHGPFGAYYFDQGSSDFTVDNNISENAPCPIFIWISSDQDINVTNTYTNSTNYRNDGTNCFVEPMKTYIKGNPTPEAKKIIDNAGLEAEYEYIKELVPDISPYMGLYEYDDYSSIYDFYPTMFYGEYAQGIEDVAKTTLELAETGDKPGQYSAQKKLMLKKRTDELTQTTRTSDKTGFGMMERMVKMRAAQKELEDSLYRLSYSETLSFAESLANDTTVNVSAGARNTLKTVINNVKSSQSDEYTKLKLLENAINNFDKLTLSTQIKGFEIKEYDFHTKIDKEKKTVTVYAEESADVSSVTAYYDVSNGCNIYPALSGKLDLTKPLQVVLKNGDAQDIWTIKAEKPINDVVNVDSWWNWQDVKPQAVGNTFVFEDSEKAYMYLGKKFNNIEFDFSTEKLDNQNGVSFIFLSDAGELIPDNNTGERSYFELKLLKDSISLYRVEDGGSKIIHGSSNDKDKTFDNVISLSDYIDNIKEKQHISIKTHTEGRRIRVDIEINGKKVINTLCEVDRVIEEGYFGIKSNTTTAFVEGIK